MQETVYDTNVPIYLQLIEKIQRMIVTGEWRAGERIPAVRELALAFGVNPNTMQRALAELERDGLLFSERTTGRYIGCATAWRGPSCGSFCPVWKAWAANGKRSCPCCGGNWKEPAATAEPTREKRENHEQACRIAGDRQTL